jgi:hypothetical protein
MQRIKAPAASRKKNKLVGKIAAAAVAMQHSWPISTSFSMIRMQGFIPHTEQ